MELYHRPPLLTPNVLVIYACTLSDPKRRPRPCLRSAAGRNDVAAIISWVNESFALSRRPDVQYCVQSAHGGGCWYSADRMSHGCRANCERGRCPPCGTSTRGAGAAESGRGTAGRDLEHGADGRIARRTLSSRRAGIQRRRLIRGFEIAVKDASTLGGSSKPYPERLIVLKDG